MKGKNKWLIFLISAFLFLPVWQDIAVADKPPWAGEDWNPSNPPAAPEPIALTLMGMAASGAAGYYLGKRKRK